jgi:hypothetical protein
MSKAYMNDDVMCISFTTGMANVTLGTHAMSYRAKSVAPWTIVKLPSWWSTRHIWGVLGISKTALLTMEQHVVMGSVQRTMVVEMPTEIEARNVVRTNMRRSLLV